MQDGSTVNDQYHSSASTDNSASYHPSFSIFTLPFHRIIAFLLSLVISFIDYITMIFLRSINQTKKREDDSDYFIDINLLIKLKNKFRQFSIVLFSNAKCLFIFSFIYLKFNIYL